MPTTIRSAQPGDAEGIAHVYVDTWRDAYPGMLPNEVLVGLSEPRHAAFWQRQITAPDEIVLVAQDPAFEPAAGIVGFGSAGRVRDPKLGHDGEVYTLYLLADWRNQGIGRSLLHGLFDALAARGFGSAIIWVLADNPSRFFYETMGGRMAAERVEKLWGAPVRQFAYGWESLQQTVA